MLYPGFTARQSDTLIITISEDVNKFYFYSIYQDDALRLYNSDNEPVRDPFLTSSYLTNTYSNQVTVKAGLGLGSKTLIMPNVDSLQLISGLDSYGNTVPQNARKTVIKYTGVNKLPLTVIPNPFNPTNGTISTTIARRYSHLIPSNTKGGAIIDLRTRLPLKKSNDGNYGCAYIYDAVGNLITRKLAISLGTCLQDYAIFWDGTNRYGRYVGQGTYLIVVSVTDVNGTNIRGQIKAGVIR